MAIDTSATVVVLHGDTDTASRCVHALASAGFGALCPSASADVAYLVQTLGGLVVVIVDLDVNGAGYEVAARLAMVTPRPRLIAITDQHPDELGHAGVFDAYVLQPFLAADLVTAVTCVLTGPGLHAA